MDIKEKPKKVGEHDLRIFAISVNIILFEVLGEKPKKYYLIKDAKRISPYMSAAECWFWLSGYSKMKFYSIGE